MDLARCCGASFPVLVKSFGRATGVRLKSGRLVSKPDNISLVTSVNRSRLQRGYYFFASSALYPSVFRA